MDNIGKHNCALVAQRFTQSFTAVMPDDELRNKHVGFRSSESEKETITSGIALYAKIIKKRLKIRTLSPSDVMLTTILNLAKSAIAGRVPVWPPEIPVYPENETPPPEPLKPKRRRPKSGT